MNWLRYDCEPTVQFSKTLVQYSCTCSCRILLVVHPITGHYMYCQSVKCTHLSDCNRPFVHHPRAAPRPPLFAIFAGLAMMLSPKVGVLSPKVGLSTQALAQPAVGVLGRRRAPRERRLGAWKGACWTSVVGARVFRRRSQSCLRLIYAHLLPEADNARNHPSKLA